MRRHLIVICNVQILRSPLLDTCSAVVVLTDGNSLAWVHNKLAISYAFYASNFPNFYGLVATVFRSQYLKARRSYFEFTNLCAVKLSNLCGSVLLKADQPCQLKKY